MSKKIEKIKYKLVYIEWEDARTVGDPWRKLDELVKTTDRNPICVKTVGWIVQEDKEKIILVASIDERENYVYVTDGTVLPKTMIRKRRVLIK